MNSFIASHPSQAVYHLTLRVSYPNPSIETHVGIQGLEHLYLFRSRVTLNDLL